MLTEGICDLHSKKKKCNNNGFSIWIEWSDTILGFIYWKIDDRILNAKQNCLSLYMKIRIRMKYVVERESLLLFKGTVTWAQTDPPSAPEEWYLERTIYITAWSFIWHWQKGVITITMYWFLAQAIVNKIGLFGSLQHKWSPSLLGDQRGGW
jgi:hypothetical protein